MTRFFRRWYTWLLWRRGLTSLDFIVAGWLFIDKLTDCVHHEAGRWPLVAECGWLVASAGLT